MTIYVSNVNIGPNFTLASNVYIKDSSSWIEPQEIYIKDGGDWKLLHKVVYITSSTNNLNLYSYVSSPSSPIRLIAHINSGVVIGSTSGAALTVGSFPAGSQIKLVNYGTIKGRGGIGGAGANYGGSAGSGEPGGIAIITTANITIENNGTIAGGGGGGGGGGYSSTSSTCFPAGTLISTPNGLVTIETLNSGDLVYGFDIYADPGAYDYSAELVAKSVTQVYKHSWSEADEFSKLLVINHEQGTLTITGNHEVLTSSREATGPYPHFVRAEHLQIGDIIYDDNGKSTKILEISPGEPYDYVYNFEVADVHTYVAGGIRVHNGYGGGGGKGTTTTTYAGGGAGGGAGAIPGIGGTGGSGAINNGTAGSSGSASAGGAGGVYNSGNGGALGSAGSGGGGSNAGSGGAAGYYINGNSYVTWTTIGTVVGLST
jgi:hypothetical protein